MIVQSHKKEHFKSNWDKMTYLGIKSTNKIIDIKNFLEINRKRYLEIPNMQVNLNDVAMEQ